MRNIGNLPDESSALTFSDYLYMHGIENEVDPSSDGSWKLWILSDDKIEVAEHYLELYLKNPDLPEYIESARLAGAQRQKKLKEEQSFQDKVYDRNRIFAWYKQFGVLTAILIAISVAVYVFGLFGYEASLRQILSIAPFNDLFILEKHPLETALGGEIWRLVTPIFIHFDPIHILFNMMWLKDLGTAIEKRHSPLALALLVLATAIPSNVAQYLFGHDPRFGGFSGVVYGLFGYIWMQARFNLTSGFRLDKQTASLMIIWFVLCLTGLVGPIANYAHGFGLAVGMAIGYSSALLSNGKAF